MHTYTHVIYSSHFQFFMLEFPGDIIKKKMLMFGSFPIVI